MSELTPKDRGDAAEAQALAHLQRQGLVPVARNYRVALGPGRRGGEIDLIVRDRDGTLVFVEVRSLRHGAPGRAAESIDAGKRARLVRAAQHFLARLPQWPPCRFDVVTIEDGRVEWLQAAFDAG